MARIHHTIRHRADLLKNSRISSSRPTRPAPVVDDVVVEKRRDPADIFVHHPPGGVALSLEGMEFSDDTDLLRSLNEAFCHTERDKLVGGAVNDQERRCAGFYVTALPLFSGVYYRSSQSFRQTRRKKIGKNGILDKRMRQAAPLDTCNTKFQEI